MTPGDKLLKTVTDMFAEAMVNDFVIAFRDPDSDMDVFILEGSTIWCAGIAQELTDESYFRRESQRTVRDDDDEEDDDDDEGEEWKETK